MVEIQEAEAAFRLAALDGKPRRTLESPVAKYDATVKKILLSDSPGFLRLLGIAGDCTRLAPNFPDARERTVDFLAVVKSPRKRAYLAHLEHQTAPDSTMGNRLLGYRADIRTWTREKEQRAYRDMTLEQTVLYVGERRWRPQTTISEPNLKFGFKFVDARDLEAAEVLKSDRLGDALLAILCNGGKQVAVIKEVIRRIAEAPEEERPNAAVKLSILSDLRGIGPRIKQEFEVMGIPVNLEDSTLLKETFDRVRNNEKVNDVLEVLKARFPDALPADIEDRLTGLSPEELTEMLRKSATVKNIEEALNPLLAGHGL